MLLYNSGSTYVEFFLPLFINDILLQYACLFIFFTFLYSLYYITTIYYRRR